MSEADHQARRWARHAGRAAAWGSATFCGRPHARCQTNTLHCPRLSEVQSAEGTDSPPSSEQIHRASPYGLALDPSQCTGVSGDPDGDSPEFFARLVGVGVVVVPGTTVALFGSGEPQNIRLIFSLVPSLDQLQPPGKVGADGIAAPVGGEEHEATLLVMEDQRAETPLPLDHPLKKQTLNESRRHQLAWQRPRPSGFPHRVVAYQQVTIQTPSAPGKHLLTDSQGPGRAPQKCVFRDDRGGGGVAAFPTWIVTMPGSLGSGGSSTE